MKGRVLCIFPVTVALIGCSARDGTGEGTEVGYEIHDQLPTTLLRTLPWLQDFKLSALACQEGESTSHKAVFAPGEAIYLSMRVNTAPRGTVVTAYWYGPGSEGLGYAKRTISPGQERLRFIRDDTLGWRPGAYRAEVWIGDIKLQGVSFDIEGTPSSVAAQTSH